MDNNKKIHTKLFNFAKEIVGEKLLKNYIKHFKIKQFQTNTLVPLALLLGKDEFSKFIRNSIQLGGGFMRKINIMEDPLICNYLKLAGLSANKIDIKTLIPIGILKLIHSMYNRNLTQKNGRLTKYIKKTWNKDIVNLLAEYQGISKLTTSTLVPLAILMDKKILNNYLINKQDINIYKKKIRFINDPLLTNYFRLIGLSKKDLYISTLVPLGILTVLHHMYYE